MHCVCKLGLGLAEVELQCLPVSQDYKSTNCQPLLTVQRDLQQESMRVGLAITLALECLAASCNSGSQTGMRMQAA